MDGTRRRSRSRSRSRNTRRSYASRLPNNARSNNIWTSRGSVLNSLPNTNVSNSENNMNSVWSANLNSSSVNTRKRGMYTINSNFKPNIKTPLHKTSARRHLLQDARALREKLLDALKDSTKPETIDTNSLYQEMNQFFYDMRPWRKVFLRDEYKEIIHTIGDLYDRTADKFNEALDKKPKSGGSQRPITSHERFIRGMIELDKANVESWEAKVDALHQDVEVLERKIKEQRANNAPARKQLQDDLTKKREELRVAKRFLEISKESLERDLKELHALENPVHRGGSRTIAWLEEEVRKAESKIDNLLQTLETAERKKEHFIQIRRDHNASNKPAIAQLQKDISRYDALVKAYTQLLEFQRDIRKIAQDELTSFRSGSNATA